MKSHFIAAVLFSTLSLALLNPQQDSEKKPQISAPDAHGLEHLDRQASITTISSQANSNAAGTTQSFYTRDDGYLVRIMKAAPTSSKAPQVIAKTSQPAPPPAAENKKRDEPSPPTQQPMLPIRPTVTMVKPSLTELPSKPANNNNNTTKPTKTSSNSQPTSKKPNNNNSNKDEEDENDAEEEEDPKKAPKKKPAENVPVPEAPARTATDPWGDYLLPTRSAKPRWMRNDSSSLVPKMLPLVICTLLMLLVA